MAVTLSRKPTVMNALRQEAFEIQARRLGLRPSDRWVGGYLDYEWDHLRHVVAALPVRLEGLKVLEFGCNVGASAILFAHLGACVTACDISEGWVELARLNARRYGLEQIDFHHITDSRALPYAAGQFDLVACNSVLEYVEPVHIGAVQREIDRVLGDGGMILLSGTSNRLWPKEVHSHEWFSNYLPRWTDHLWGRPRQRGLAPWRARYGFGAHYTNLDAPAMHGLFARSRLAMGMPAARLVPLMALASVLGVGPGLLAPNISCLLQKRGEK